MSSGTRARHWIAVAGGISAGLLVLGVAVSARGGGTRSHRPTANAGVLAAPATEPADPCPAAREDVEAAGLRLPARFEFRCPADVARLGGEGHGWGLSCADSPNCPQQAYVAIDVRAMGGDGRRLRYVVAHEFCHAVEYEAGRSSSEEAADACAAGHGFPPV